MSFLFLLFRLIANLIDRIHSDKRLGIGLLHVVHQLLVLGVIHDGDDLPANGVIVGTDGIIEGRAAVQVMENIVGDLLHLGRQDADPALDVHAKNEMVHNEAAQISTQKAEEHRFCERF